MELLCDSGKTKLLCDRNGRTQQPKINLVHRALAYLNWRRTRESDASYPAGITLLRNLIGRLAPRLLMLGLVTEARMATLSKLAERSREWSPDALAMAAQARVLSGNKLEQLVVRLQRQTDRSREECWRFIIRYGIKGRPDYRRWTEAEVEIVREELVKRSIEDIAKRINRTPKAIRNMLRRNRLSLRQIRCDLFSLESLASALHVRKAEVVFWIEKNWLRAFVPVRGTESFTLT